MKKLLSISLTVLMVVLCFAGCGKKDKVISKDRTAYKYNMAEYVKLCDYKSIKIDASAEDYVAYYNSVYEGIVANAGAYVETKTGTTKKDDLINITYIGKLKDGTVFTGAADQNSAGEETVDAIAGSGQFIPDFDAALLNKEVGKTFKVNTTFPKDYQAAALKGKQAVFTITVNSIKTIPEKNDETAKKLGYDNLKVLTDYLRETTVKTFIYEEVIKKSEIISYPKAEQDYYNKTYDDYMNAADEQAKQYNEYYAEQIKSGDAVSATKESMIQYLSGMTAESLKASLDNQLKRDCIVFAIFDDAKLTYRQSDYDKALNGIVASTGATVEQVNESYEKWIIEAAAALNVTFDYLMDTVEVINEK